MQAIVELKVALSSLHLLNSDFDDIMEHATWHSSAVIDNANAQDLLYIDQPFVWSVYETV